MVSIALLLNQYSQLTNQILQQEVHVEAKGQMPSAQTAPSAASTEVNSRRKSNSLQVRMQAINEKRE